MLADASSPVSSTAGVDSVENGLLSLVGRLQGLPLRCFLLGASWLPDLVLLPVLEHVGDGVSSVAVAMASGLLLLRHGITLTTPT